MRRALATALVLLAGPLAAQQAEPEPSPFVTIVPAPGEGGMFRFPRVEPVKTVDIPQWAKDEGHNGRAVYRATISPDNTLVGLELMQSSGSAAIDAAVKARAETLWYKAGTDPAGKPIESRIPVAMEYARHDKDSPGGGIETYTCGDLVREFEWYMAANVDSATPFLPQLIYVGLRTYLRLEQGEPVDVPIMDADADERRPMWQALLERCRNAPQRLMLDEVDYPETFSFQIARY